MGRKSKRKADADETPAPWCYYCDRSFEDVKILIQHQKAKHFKCAICQRKMNTIGGLCSHSQKEHKEPVLTVPSAVEGRTNVHVSVVGMEGIPEEYDEGSGAARVASVPSAAGLAPPSYPPMGLPPFGRPPPPMPYGMPPLGGFPAHSAWPPGGMLPPRPTMPGPAPATNPLSSTGMPPHGMPMQPHIMGPPRGPYGMPLMAQPPFPMGPPVPVGLPHVPAPTLSAPPLAPPSAPSYAGGQRGALEPVDLVMHAPAAGGAFSGAGPSLLPPPVTLAGPGGLVWQDEVLSMEERRAMLPKYGLDV